MIRRASSRSAFTLVELIVAMSVMIILASIALMVVPSVLEQDRTTDGAARLQQYLMIAKMRASRDNLPRGLRLIDSGGFATEVQYIEAPPLYVPPNPSDPRFDTATAPLIEFVFTPNADGTMPTAPGGRVIKLKHLNADLRNEIAGGGSVIIPDLHVWFSFDAGGYDPGSETVTPNMSSGVSPYPEMGAGTSLVTYQFGIYGPPQALLGEPVQQLPTNIAVDFGSSQGLAANREILFAPSGEVSLASSGQIFLWVRDRTKPGGNGGDFDNGGEQQIVGIKTRAGSLGVFPVAWPGTNPDPFFYAKNGSTGS